MMTDANRSHNCLFGKTFQDSVERVYRMVDLMEVVGLKTVNTPKGEKEERVWEQRAKSKVIISCCRISLLQVPVTRTATALEEQ
jgi:hypothetical protein